MVTFNSISLWNRKKKFYIHVLLPYSLAHAQKTVHFIDRVITILGTSHKITGWKSGREGDRKSQSRPGKEDVVILFN